MSETLRFDAREKAELAERGFVLRRGVFDAAELHEIANACEALVQRLLAEERRTKHSLGSYMFELQRKLETIVKWEPGHPDLVQGVEPFAHLNEELHRCALDRRFLEPCKDVVGEEEVILFTEKLNLKRAHKGGPIILHQDFPYWADQTAAASRVATAMLFLDDATAENGCLEVVPGSHREGVQKRRAVEGLGAMEIDTAKYDHSRLVQLPVQAGAVVFFGPFLVHRSMPNRSRADRRALLYSYQPAGFAHLRDLTWRPRAADGAHG
ncbi:MAG TPA: phytanoyl-CoA dioxygenase family protein [Candidatus Binataceae bacterium]|nr:phytanoyl-CoA dioxygenase family protein [Candidatus Binataceae bacterium]